MADEKTYEELYNEGFENSNIDFIESEKEEPEEKPSLEFDEEDNQEDQGEEEEPEDTDDDAEEQPDEDGEEDAQEPSEKDSNGRYIKWQGQEIFIENDEIDTFIQKGFDYTKKTQDLAKYRPFIEMINENNLTQEDMITLRDAKLGNPEAIAEIIKKSNVDVSKITDDTNYKPQVVERNWELEDVVNEIKDDLTYSGVIDRYVAAMPQNTKDLFVKNPQVLRGLYEDAKSGIAEKIMPELIKQMAINPNTDFLNAYQTIGQKAFLDESSKEEQIRQDPNREIKKRAAITKKTNTVIKNHTDIWEDDELFEKMMRMTDPFYRK